MTDRTDPPPAVASDEPGGTVLPTAADAAAPARRRLLHRPRTRRGFLLGGLVILGLGALVTLGAMKAVAYTETAGFCGRCHTMDAELKAYAMSPHRDVACAECHVAPGIGGWVAAKAKGTKQLVQVLTNTFPKPVPPPDHADLPPVQDTCLKCHALDQLTSGVGPVTLVLRPRYRADEANTREMVAVVVRSASPNPEDGRGVHWHVDQQVTYTTDEERAQTIGLVEATRADGTVATYVAADEIGSSADARADVDRLRRTQRSRTMDCLDCHNRVGHGSPLPDEAVDQALASGRISASLPYIKRHAVPLLEGDYPTNEAADAAIDGLARTYATQYPLVPQGPGSPVTQAVGELKAMYRLMATPDMKVQALTYPDNLGHRSAPGCFRCHDGAHVRVEGGKASKKTIPSTCSTCHTFPQVAQEITSVLIGKTPKDHADRQYVFSHKDATPTIDPSSGSCGTCHTRASCENCHVSGAVSVSHDEMLYNHAGAVRKSGPEACAYCHQPVYCATCHENPVLGTPDPQPSPSGQRAAGAGTSVTPVVRREP